MNKAPMPMTGLTELVDVQAAPLTEQQVMAMMLRWRASYLKFCVECLGFQEDAEIRYVNLNAEHKELCKFMQYDVHRMKMILMPRYSLKSSLITVGYSLWRIFNNPNVRILIYSDSAEKAMGFLSGVKNHILGEIKNSRWREILGAWEGQTSESGEWTGTQIVVNQRSMGGPEPTVDTAGIETSRVGKHYDLIIFDDIVSDMNIATRQLLEKVYGCYKRALSLLKPNGDVVMVGTRWAFGDAYGRIIEENRNSDPLNSNDWGFFIRKAEVNKFGVKSYPFETIGLTKEFLESQRERQGTHTYSCLYQNNPIDDADAVFRNESFRFYAKDSLDHSNMYKTCVCDPAGEGRDFTAFTVVGTDNKMVMHVLDAVNRHMNPDQILFEIFRLSYIWKFTKFGIEKNFFRGLFEKEIKIELEKHRNNRNFCPFSVEEFMSTSRKGEGKHARIMALQPYHERGDLLFPTPFGTGTVDTLRGAFYDLAMQMMQYTQHHRPAYDDLVDSLAYHVKMVQRGGVSPDAPDEEWSVKGILQRRHEQMVELTRKLPRRYRPREPVFA